MKTKRVFEKWEEFKALPRIEKIEIIAFWAITMYILLLVLETFISVPEVVHYCFLILFVSEIAYRISILKGKFFEEKVNWFDLLLLILSFIPGYEMARVFRLLVFFARRKEMQKTIRAIEMSSKELKDWNLIILTVSSCFALYMCGILGNSYPNIWGNYFLSIEAMITITFMIENNEFYSSVSSNNILLYFVVYRIFLTIVASFMMTSLIGSVQKINNEEMEEHLRKQKGYFSLSKVLYRVTPGIFLIFKRKKV